MDEKEFHSGFVSIIGRPNVGKSTLINYLLGQKIAAVSPRPQTTRRLQLGIITTEAYQLIFVDTPGIHKPLSKLGEVMNDSALGTLQDVDCIAWMVDGTMLPTEEDRMIAKQLAKIRNQDQNLLLINKCDQHLQKRHYPLKKYQELLSIEKRFHLIKKW